MSIEPSPRKSKKRQQILEAATLLFCKFGYGVSMDAIAEEASVSKQTVYAHFSGKDELFETCIIEKCIRSGLDWDLQHDDRPPHDVLREYGWLFHSMLAGEEARSTFQNTIKQADTHPDVARIFLEQGPVRNINLLSMYLTKLRESGSITQCQNTQHAAMQLLLMLHGRRVYWGFFGIDSGESEEERRIYVRSCVDTFLRGVGYRESLS